MKKLILTLWMILALGACKEETKPQAQQKSIVKIGAIYPMSGDGGIFGQAAKKAADMFFEEFHSKPSKFKYQIIFEDNQNKLSKQALLAQKLINVDKVDVIITVMSNFGAVVSPLAEQNKVLHFSTATDASVAKGKYNFIASSNMEGEIDLLYRQLVKKGAQNIDVVIAQATGPEQILSDFRKKIDIEKKLNINQVYRVNQSEKDFRLMFQKIKNDKSDYIMAILAMPTIDVFMRQYFENKINIPVTGIETFSYLQNKELAEGMWYVDAAPPRDDYVKKYQAKTGAITTDYAEYMDLILQMITFGYEGAGTTDKRSVADYVEDNASGQKTAIGIISTAPDGFLNGQPVIKKIMNGETIIIKE